MNAMSSPFRLAERPLAAGMNKALIERKESSSLRRLLGILSLAALRSQPRSARFRDLEWTPAVEGGGRTLPVRRGGMRM